MTRFILAAMFAVLFLQTASAQTPVAQCWQNETGSPPRINCVPGIIPATTTASASSLLIKAAPGVLNYLLVYNNTAVATHVLVIDAAAVPADGAVTPKICRQVGANATVELNYSGGPGVAFSNGIVAALTTTGSCYTKTTGATDAYMTGLAQ